jgi:hypothetical protein
MRLTPAAWRLLAIMGKWITLLSLFWCIMASDPTYTHGAALGALAGYSITFGAESMAEDAEKNP